MFDVRYVPAAVLEGAEWAIACGEREAYLIANEDVVGPRVLREAWQAWEAHARSCWPQRAA